MKNIKSLILGISCFFHDSAACLLSLEGSLVAAVQEERFTRVKHDSSFPVHAINYCLQHAGIEEEDLGLIVFYEDQALALDRISDLLLRSPAMEAAQAFRGMCPSWIDRKLDIPRSIRAHLPGFRGQILAAQHHQAHAAAAFFPSPFEEAAILTIDGVGEWATTTISRGDGKRIELLEELHFPDSLGLFYSAATWYLGFKVNSGEYKVMGLAPYGQPVYQDLIEEHVIDLSDDGSLKLSPEYFCFTGHRPIATDAWGELLGEARRDPESRLTQFHWDVARSIQAVTEKAMLGLAQRAAERTGSRNLCMSGGVALNCVGNGKIAAAGIFDHLWIQPAAGDAGNALGAALAGWHIHCDHDRSVSVTGADSMQDSLLGPSYSSEEICDFLDFYGFPYEVLDEESLPATTASLLSEGKVIGLFQGRMEFGPRALGARSIIADPRDPEMQRTLNLKVKFRESFRPFAPIVLEEHAAEWFELKEASPYMLLVAPVLEERRLAVPDVASEILMDRLNLLRSSVPSITHVDYSARLQTVAKGRGAPRLRGILEAFHENSGVPILVNTSFNLRSEPIVCSPMDAYRCMMRSSIDCLLMENILVRRENQPDFFADDDWQKEFELD